MSTPITRATLDAALDRDEMARALYVAAHNDGSTWEDAPEYQRAFYRRQADAVLAHLMTTTSQED